MWTRSSSVVEAGLLGGPAGETRPLRSGLGSSVRSLAAADKTGARGAIAGVERNGP